MGRERRKWTDEEDKLLREAVKKANQESRPLLWRELAKSVPGRTNKDCRRRWCNTLVDGVTKGSWTESEDERLCNAVREYGSKWTWVAAAVGSRNSDQCSSHWSQTLNPDIDYSDWTKDEDERLLQAVQRWGTNWTKIVSKHLPNRTTLALKNRYSALRTKSIQVSSRSKKSRTRLRTSSHRPSLKKSSKQVDFDDYTFAVPDDREDDDQTDGDDEDEDEDTDDDDSEVNDAGSFLNISRQESQPVNGGAVQGQASSAHIISQSSPLRLPAQTNTQQSFDPPSLTGQWEHTLQDTGTFSSPFPLGFFQNSKPDSSSHTSVLPEAATDGAPQPIALQSYQNPYKDNVAQAALPAYSPTTYPVINKPRKSVDYKLQREQACSSNNNDKPSPPSWISPMHQGLMDQHPGDQGQSGTPEMAPLPEHTLFPFTPLTSDESLQRVSIDAMCTNEQLGNIMRSVAGHAKSVTVKVNE